MIKNVAYNLTGLGIPLILAVVTIPLLIESLGVDRFGMLTLIWAVVSYFGLFDMGLGRSLTLLLSRKLSTNTTGDVNSLIWTALMAMLGLGVVAGFLLYSTSFFWVGVLSTEVDNHELRLSILIMSIAIPLVVLTTGYRGVLESVGSFFSINAIRVPMGIYTFVAPLLVVNFWGSGLDKITLALLLGRVFALIPHVVLAHRKMSLLSYKASFDMKHIKPLASFGGWITVSNIISPLMNYVDRFVVGALLGASNITFYVTPQEVVTKLSIIPSALTAVLFPVFSAEYFSGQRSIERRYYKSLLSVFLVMLIPVLILSAGSHWIISMWISTEFADESYQSMSILAWGVFVGSIATIPFTVVQASGLAKLTAFFHLIELPVFLIMLYFLTKEYGIVGAASSWAFRNLLDMVLLLVAAGKIVKKSKCNDF